MTKAYDALIIGAGHNGLVCAFYLARAGLKVRIVEARDVVGGASIAVQLIRGDISATGTGIAFPACRGS